MNAIPIDLAVEDELSDAVLRRLIAVVRRDFEIGRTHRNKGFGYLKRTIPGWNDAAKGIPMMVLTDLDQHKCPAGMLDDWLPNGRHPNLLFRVAVRDVEAWLLADRKGLAGFLQCSPGALPEAPESLADPKAALIDAARRSRSRQLRDDIVPRRGSTAKIGRGYNAVLTVFVRESWAVAEAAGRAPSLARAVARLETFRPVWLGT